MQESMQGAMVGVMTVNTGIPETTPKKNSPAIGCGVLVIAAIIMLAAFGVFNSTPPDGDKSSAEAMCEKFVSKQLRAPATAKFSGMDDTSIAPLGDRQWKAVGYVDAQNAFGALIRNDYSCTVRYLGDDKWRSIDVTILPR